jgi:hypothetical protein
MPTYGHSLSTGPNPLKGTPPDNVKFTRHALYRIEQRGLTLHSVLRTLLQAPTLDYRIDDKTGHFVSKLNEHYIVWRKDSGGGITIITIMRSDDVPRPH